MFWKRKRENESMYNNHKGVACCFCGESIEENIIEICLIKENESGEQYLYAHEHCVREHIKYAPIA